MAHEWNGILCSYKIKRGSSLQSDIKPSPALNEKKQGVKEYILIWWLAKNIMLNKRNHTQRVHDSIYVGKINLCWKKTDQWSLRRAVGRWD